MHTEAGGGCEFEDCTIQPTTEATYSNIGVCVWDGFSSVGNVSGGSDMLKISHRRVPSG